MATFFAKENNLSISELEEMIRLAESEQKSKETH
jgi:hypothetical protein